MLLVSVKEKATSGTRPVSGRWLFCCGGSIAFPATFCQNKLIIATESYMIKEYRRETDMGADGKTKERSGNGSLYREFLKMTILPLIALGLAITIYCSYAYTSSMHKQVERGLQNVALTVLAAYDTMYEGEFRLVAEQDLYVLYKGDHKLSGDDTILDSVKRETNLDLSLFFYDMRMLTTIRDENGDRYIGKYASERIVDGVLKEKNPMFFDNAKIGKDTYFGYYLPILSEDDTSIGMLAVARPVSDVDAVIHDNIGRIIGIVLILILLTALLLVIFSRRITDVIRKIMGLLQEMSKGKLSAKLDHSVLNRGDELGDMGRFTVKVQASLRKLVERDALTGLYNRRSGESRHQETFRCGRNTGERYCICIGDIDFFKKVNDTYGHEAGDAVLREVARLLRDGMAGKGYVARWGGEEFLIVLEDCNVEGAEQILTEILNRIREHVVEFGEERIRVTMTFGVTAGGVQADPAAELAVADELLYCGKKNGRNRIVTELEKDEETEGDVT